MKYTTKQQLLPTNEAQTEGPMSTISLRMPEKLVEELKAIAPQLGFSGYQPLIRAYVGQGLNADKERLQAGQELSVLVESLRSQGVAENILGSAVAEARAVYQAHATLKPPPMSNRGRKEQALSWQAFVAATYGAFAEEPLERPNQSILEERERLR